MRFATPKVVRRATALSPLVGLGVLAVLAAQRRSSIELALGDLSLEMVAALAALHLSTLALRAEAWRLILNAGAAEPLRRRHVHGASAGAYLVGTVEIHCAMPARIHLLRRLAGPGAPDAVRIVLADLPILLLEVAGSAAALAVAGLVAPIAPWWVAPAIAVAAVSALVALAAAHRRSPGGRLSQGLAVLGDGPRRTALGLIVSTICLIFVLRAWLALSVFGLPDSLADACVLYVLLGAFGLLPLGPSASAGATLAAFGAGAIDPATAAGIAISATTVLAVAAYAVFAATWCHAAAHLGPSAARAGRR